MHRFVRTLAAGVVVGLFAPLALGSPASAQYEDHRGSDAEAYTIVRSTATESQSDRWADFLRLMAIPSSDTGYDPALGGTPEELACPRSRCRDLTVPVPDSVRITSNTVRVYYPVGYSAKKNRDVRYPVVYLYPGARSPYTRWSTIFDLLTITRPLQAIFVMPEGGIGKDAGMFSDWVDGSWQWETYHVDYLVPFIARRTRALDGAVGAVGASAGALGALNYAARHPGTFQGVLSISGVADTTILTGNALPEQISPVLGFSPPDLSRVWGNPVLDRANWDAHNPTMNVEAYRDITLLLASGTGYGSNETPTGDPIHTPFQEMLLWNSHRTFLEALTRAGIPYQARIRQGGLHYWTFFAEQLEWGLPKLVRSLYKKADAAPPSRV